MAIEDDIIKAIEKGFAKAGGGKKASDAPGGAARGKPKASDVPGLQEDLKLLEEYEKKLQGLGKSETARYAQAEQSRLVAQKQLEIIQAQLAAKDDLTAADAEALRQAELLVEQADLRIEKLDAQTKKMEEQIQAAKDFTSALGTGLADMATGLIKNLLTGIMDMIFQLDQMETTMMRATGMSRELAGSFADGSDAVSKYWVSTEQYGEAVTDLWRVSTEFSQLQPEMQQQLAATTSVLMSWGVAASDMAGGLQSLIKVMGQTAEEADATLLSMSALAMDLGVPIDQMMSDFNTMMPELAALGPTAADSFREMARVAKVTGLEVGKLLNITKKFDTFEGAAESVGQINAALGGNFVNAMDMMMTTDPIERFEMLRGALDDAGLSFDEMSYYQRQFMAESMGLDSVADLAAMMSGDMSGLSDEVGMTAADYEAQAEAAAQAASVQEKFQGFLDDIMRTLVDSGMLDQIHEIFDQFSKGEGPLMAVKDKIVALGEVFKTKIEPAIKWIIDNWPEIIAGFEKLMAMGFALWVANLASSIFTVGRGFVQGIRGIMGWVRGLQSAKAVQDGVKASTTATTAAQAASNAQTPATVAAQQSQTASTGVLGTVSKISAKHILALGFAALLMGAGIAIAALGVAELVGAFAGFSAGEILAISVALLVFGGAITAMAYLMLGALPGLAVAVPAIYALGGAMLMMGIGVAIAAVGFAHLVEAFANLGVDVILAMSVAFIAFGYSLVLAGAGITTLGLALMSLMNPLALAGLMVLEGMVGGMVVALGALAIILLVIMIPMIMLFDLLSDPSGITTAAAEMASIARSINSVSLMKTMALGSALSSAGSGNGNNSGSSSQNVTIRLDRDGTKRFLEGLAVDAQGRITSRSAGVT